MNARVWTILILAAGGAAAVGAALRPSPSPAVETIGFTRPLESAPAMCPWRTPESDRRAFFPGADRSELRTLVLSGLRVPLARRLGPGTPLESNVLYAYPVFQRGTPRGTVLVQRTAGEYGALEVVVGVGTDGKVAGARVQRCREPRAVASAIQSPQWLGAFRGKTADSAWTVGQDLPAVPARARPAAQVVARTARALLIEWDVASKKPPR